LHGLHGLSSESTAFTADEEPKGLAISTKVCNIRVIRAIRVEELLKIAFVSGYEMNGIIRAATLQRGNNASSGFI